MKSFLLSLSIFLSACATTQAPQSRMPSSTNACIPHSQSCTLGESCRPEKAIAMAKVKSKGAKNHSGSLFKQGIKPLYIVKKLTENSYEFVTQNIRGNRENYSLWSDENSDNVMQSEEIIRNPIFNDLIASQFSVDSVHQYADVDQYGNEITHLKIGKTKPWAIFLYQTPPCATQNTQDDVVDSNIDQ